MLLSSSHLWKRKAGRLSKRDLKYEGLLEATIVTKLLGKMKKGKQMGGSHPRALFSQGQDLVRRLNILRYAASLIPKKFIFFVILLIPVFSLLPF